MNENSCASTLASYVARVRHLYTLPAVAAEVLRLTSEPTFDVRSIKECIENDPALTTRILRVVNSSLFGLSRQVTDLNQALALLGVKPLKMLVLGFSLPRNLQSTVDADVLSRYWKHSLLKAIASRQLATRVFKISGDEAFLAGLLQDVGMLAMVQDLGESFTRFLDHVASHGGNLLDLELDALGFDHLIVSSRLLDSWGLPETMTSAIAMRGDCEQILRLEQPTRKLAMSLHLAELLVRMTEQPFGSSLHDLLAAGEKYGGLSAETVQAIAVEMDERVVELATILNLDLPTDKTTCELLIAAHSQLSLVACDAARDMVSANLEDDLLTTTTALGNELRLACSLPAISTAPPATSTTKPPPPAVSNSSIPIPIPIANTSAAASPLRTPSATEVDYDPGLLGTLSVAIAQARAARQPVTLAMLEIDRHADLLYTLGASSAHSVMHEVGLALDRALYGDGRVMELASGRWAVVLVDYERSLASSLLRRLQTSIKQWSESPTSPTSAANITISLSIGLATVSLPSKNFPSSQLLDAAHRCLTGATLSGGDTLKSIEF